MDRVASDCNISLLVRGSLYELPFGDSSLDLVTCNMVVEQNSATSCCALRRAVGLGKLSVTILPDTRRVRRNCGSCPGSLCLAQWQEGLPQRRVTAVIEPRRRSPKPRNSSRSWNRWLSNIARCLDIGLLSVPHSVCYTDVQRN